MKASSRVAAPRASDQSCRRIGGQDMPGIHQRYPIAALRLVHEVRGNENRHFLIARQIDQDFPEPVAGQRIDSRCRLVEDQDLRLVNDGDGQRYPLSNPQRQIEGPLIEIVLEAKAIHQLRDPGVRLLRRYMEQVGMKIEVLLHREFGVERERL